MTNLSLIFLPPPEMMPSRKKLTLKSNPKRAAAAAAAAAGDGGDSAPADADGAAVAAAAAAAAVAASAALLPPFTPPNIFQRRGTNPSAARPRKGCARNPRRHPKTNPFRPRHVRRSPSHSCRHTRVFSCLFHTQAQPETKNYHKKQQPTSPPSDVFTTVSRPATDNIRARA